MPKNIVRFKYLFLALFIFTIAFLVFPRQQKVISKDRAIVIILEDAGMLASEDIELYKDNKFIFDRVLSLVFGIPRSEFDKKDITQLIDEYGEPYLYNKIVNQAQGYSKKIVLSDNQATFDNFTQTLIDLNNGGYTTDLVIHLHGNTNSLVFFDKTVNQNDLTNNLKNQNLKLGFVYEVSCYGSYFSQTWLALGAKVVSGTVSINSYPLFAPSKFMHEMMSGKSFETAVVNGYNRELKIWSLLGYFLEGAGELSRDPVMTSSKMVIVGERNLRVF